MEHRHKNSPQYKTILNFYKYHYPPTVDIIQELEAIKCKPLNPEYQGPATNLEKLIYLAKVIQILLQHKNQQCLIVTQIEDNIIYFLGELSKISNAKIRAKTTELLKIMTTQEGGKEQKIMSGLLEIKKLKYYGIKTSQLSDVESHVRWCMSLMMGIPESYTNEIFNAIVTLYEHYLYSISTFALLAKKIHLAESLSYTECPDGTFNSLFNLIVFWTTVLSMYRKVIYENLLDECVLEILNLLRKESREFFSWYDLTAPSLGSETLVKFFEHLVRNLNVHSSPLTLSEIGTYAYHCKLAVINLQ